MMMMKKNTVLLVQHRQRPTSNLLQMSTFIHLHNIGFKDYLMHICITLCIHTQTRAPLTQYYIDQYSFHNNNSCICHWDPMRAGSVYTMLKSLYVKA
jgi:hypothetical protein